MTLALLVYLVSVVPTIGVAFMFLAVVAAIGFGIFFIGSAISLDVYGYHGEEHQEVKKARSTQKYLRTKLWIPIALIFFAVLIPDKTTLYTMIAAYAGQKIAETPQAQQIGNDAVDVLHELLAKAKRELKEPEEKKSDK